VNRRGAGDEAAPIQREDHNSLSELKKLDNLALRLYGQRPRPGCRPTTHASLPDEAGAPVRMSLEPGLGLGTCFHLVPLHCRTRVTSPVPLEERPTAHALAGEVAPTPSRSFLFPDLGHPAERRATAHASRRPSPMARPGACGGNDRAGRRGAWPAAALLGRTRRGLAAGDEGALAAVSIRARATPPVPPGPLNDFPHRSRRRLSRADRVGAGCRGR